jgi:hypothetical protein
MFRHEHVEKSSVIDASQYFIKVRKRHREQTTTFHASTVSRSMSILIDKNKRKIVQAKIQVNILSNESI